MISVAKASFLELVVSNQLQNTITVLPYLTRIKLRRICSATCWQCLVQALRQLNEVLKEHCCALDDTRQLHTELVPASRSQLEPSILKALHNHSALLGAHRKSLSLKSRMAPLICSATCEISGT